MKNEKTKKKASLADARLAVIRLLLLPDDDSKLTKQDLELLRSDLAGDILYGKYPELFPLWTTKPQ